MTRFSSISLLWYNHVAALLKRQQVVLWIPLVLFLGLGNDLWSQTTILSDPGMTYTNSDGPTGPDVYSVDVSNCTSISYSVDYSFSLPWERRWQYGVLR